MLEVASKYDRIGHPGLNTSADRPQDEWETWSSFNEVGAIPVLHPGGYHRSMLLPHALHYTR
jgi:hypothetical protein